MFLGNTHKSSDLLIPWCTYTDPEIAHVGRYESDLPEGQYEVFIKHLRDVDRCMCDGVSDGFVKIIVQSGTCEIVGATICAPHAGDMISEPTLCIQHGLKVQDLSGIIHPYPTTQEATRLAALGFNKYFKSVDGAAMRTLSMVMANLEQH
jgi:pyruvate/2-oxoglutarate dehydrogenase complex dihydrolipoamide dehydrogenase (E3) component